MTVSAPYGLHLGTKPFDPQLGPLLNQGSKEWNVFTYLVLQKRADLVIQQTGLEQFVKTVRDKTEVLREEVPVRSLESEEMRWLVDNARALEDYRGEWLLILGRHLVAHCPNFEDVRIIIVQRAISSPFVYYVPTQQESNFIAV